MDLIKWSWEIAKGMEFLSSKKVVECSDSMSAFNIAFAITMLLSNNNDEIHR